MSGALPKPPRIEKWQRWRDSRAVMFTAIEDTGNGDRWRLRKDGDIGHWFGSDMLARSGWTFLGYAKPDKVEVGQRWRVNDISWTAEHETGRWPGERQFRHSSADRMGKAFLYDADVLARAEYLGMAESADTDEQRRMTDVDVEAGLHTDAAPRVPITKKVDPKAEARRANEEAAKRLIENPPEWAYPKAWMCAVLWCMEQRDGNAALLDSLDEGAAWMFIGLYQRLRGEGMTHESARDKATKREVPIVRDIVNAYARGMERPSPLMGRPGVKGGMSTCDLGGEYE